jgi:catechol 2,3-dioxygenase-like lactoylglutathione lyase family enzyme
VLTRIWDITFTVADLEIAVAFYENVLGLSKKYHFPDDYAGFDCGGVEIGLSPGILDTTNARASCVNFLVDNVDETVRILQEHGVHFVKEPHDTAWGGRIAIFTDPDGNKLQLVQIDWHKYFSACA